MGYTVVCWPESQNLMGKVGFFQNCSLINSQRGVDTYGSSAYLVNEEWYKQVEAGEISDTDLYDDSEELNICYDDTLIFGGN